MLFMRVEPRTDQFEKTPLDYICQQYQTYICKDNGVKILNQLKALIAKQKAEKEAKEKEIGNHETDTQESLKKEKSCFPEIVR